MTAEEQEREDARRRFEQHRYYRDAEADHDADEFADPDRGLAHAERHQLATRRPFGARGR